VGLGGLEPPPSSLSAITRLPLCNPAFLQVARDRKRRSNALFERGQRRAVEAVFQSSRRGSHHSRCHGVLAPKMTLTCTASPSAQPTPHPIPRPAPPPLKLPTVHRQNALAITDASHRLTLLSTPTFSEDSSAPRRQLDGGVAPAADGHGGGRARPGSPCCRAVLVGWSPRRRLPGGASSRHPAVGRCRRSRQGQDAGHGVVAGRVHHVVSTQWFRRPGPTVQPSGVRPSGVRPSGVRPSGVQPAAVRLRRSGRVHRVPPQTAVATRSRRRQPSPPERAEVSVGCRVVERLDERPSRPGRGRCCRGRGGQWGSVADPGQVG
jgi:hypothetical protein